MRSVSWFGVVHCDRPTARIIDVAITIAAQDFFYDDRGSDSYDLSLLNEFKVKFPPTRKSRVLSGFLAALYPGVDAKDLEYREPNASTKYLPFGIALASASGDTEAAAHILKKVLRPIDRATLWWQWPPVDGEPAEHGVFRIENNEIELGVLDEVSADNDGLVAEYRALFDAAAGFSRICCPSPFESAFPFGMEGR